MGTKWASPPQLPFPSILRGAAHFVRRCAAAFAAFLCTSCASRGAFSDIGNEVSYIRTYVNPGNSGFTGIRNDIYVDKSGVISLVNQTINTPRRLSCISRPRRFWKSFATKMLCAYYDKTCDSSELFDDLAIASDEQISSTYRKH